MIRIYPDWGVISNLKKPENKGLKEFIEKNREHLQFPYSPAHFSDLLKSNSPGNDLFNEDLKTLGHLSLKHLIKWDGKRTHPYLASPTEYLQWITENGHINFEDFMDMDKFTEQMNQIGVESGLGNIGTLYKEMFQMQPIGFEINDSNKEYLNSMFPGINSTSTMWDFIKEMGPLAKNILQDRKFYKDFRKSIHKGFKLEDNSGNWEVKEVINNIDTYLKQQGIDKSFHDYINFGFKDRKEPVNRYEYFISAYFTLDMIGYKSDRLRKKTDTGQNISNDAEHAFYGAHCDYFITSDRKLRTKAMVLYSTFNISTIVLSPEEVISTIEKIIHTVPNNEHIHFAEEAVNHFDLSKIIVELHENEYDAFGYKLKVHYFNFFNYVAFWRYTKENSVIFEFKKVFKNYSDFIYFTETERLISTLLNFFGYDNDDMEQRKQNFIYGNEEEEFVWNYKNITVVLKKDTETHRPILIYAIKI